MSRITASLYGSIVYNNSVRFILSAFATRALYSRGVQLSRNHCPVAVDKKRAPERLLLLLRGMFTEYTRTRLYLFVAPTCAAAQTTVQIVSWPAIRRKRDCYGGEIYRLMLSKISRLLIYAGGGA